MYARPNVRDDGGLVRSIQPGDTMGMGLVKNILATVGAGTLTAALLAAGIIVRTSSGGAFADTLDTAALIIASFSGNSNGPRVGETFLVYYVNLTGAIMTITTAAGITLTGNAAVAVASKALLFITITSATTVDCVVA